MRGALVRAPCFSASSSPGLAPICRSSRTAGRTGRTSDAAIRGHVFCSFLALVLQKELAERCRAAGFTPEWDDVLRGLDRLQQAEVIQDGKTWTVRTDVGPTASVVLRACGIAIPPRIQGIPPPVPPRPAQPQAQSAGATPGVMPRAPNFPVLQARSATCKIAVVKFGHALEGTRAGKAKEPTQDGLPGREVSRQVPPGAAVRST